TIVSREGVNAVHQGRKNGFAHASTDTDAAIADPAADTIVITTRHDTHAHFVIKALEAGKHVFVEKPLCMDIAQWESLKTAMESHPSSQVMVGFNRRFAPHILRMKQLLSGVQIPKSFVITVNAGAIPANHWTQDRATGGGRIIGEACHFIDLLRDLAGHP
ncbi:MAG: Gfo/Idh/MocA family protein, partial [Chitinophagaceae bacterium]